jgi:hypothetical protein
MSKIIYLGHFTDGEEKRNVSPAGVTMMNYIIESINAAGYDLTVLSPAGLSGNETGPRVVRRLNPQTTCVYLPTPPRSPRWMLPVRLKNRSFRRRALEQELERVIQDGDTLVVYHSMTLMDAVAKLRKKRDFRFVLQVCEIYSDVTGDLRQREKELTFIKQADAYIFSSVLLEKELNTERRPYAVCLGQYRPGPLLSERYDDGKCHVVYAGTFDPRKGGAAFAVEASGYLPSSYHVHILGFGNEKDTQNIVDLVAEVSSRSQCSVSYDGLLTGDAYTAFLQCCHIGLSTQDPCASFNATSFPSKILSYMSNGLRVVSIRIPAIETSEVGQYMYYYDEQTPEEIAKAIMAVDLKDAYDPRAVLDGMDRRFRDAVRDLLEP